MLNLDLVLSINDICIFFTAIKMCDALKRYNNTLFLSLLNA